MYICHCRGVTDRTIRAAIASGAGSVDKIGQRCGAGVDCGGCHLALEELLDEAAARLEARRRVWGAA
jgi:bacterioferritin-associated ferredoxin